ncbi:MAG: flippase-like domain-containing protein [Nocardiaceae bacterium]|nr:flippase-like domain-containing protein [Nocardiaceae bacterium]
MVEANLRPAAEAEDSSGHRLRSWRAVIVIAALAFAAYMLIPQFDDIWRAFGLLGDGHGAWLMAAIVASGFTYVGAALTLKSASPQRLRLGRTAVVAVATTFANQFAPFGLGGDAVNVRYLEKTGHDRETAVGVVAATLGAGVVLHVFSLVVAVLWLGVSATFIRSALPSAGTVAIVVGLAVLAVVLIWFVVRRRPDLVERARDAAASVGRVLKQPRRAVMLVTGQGLLIVAYIAALGFSLHAFGAHPSALLVAAVYLGGTAVGSTAPTPSGLGVLEAALVGGFVVGGVATAPAIAGVLTFRLATLWLPALVGWAAYRILVRQEFL